MAEYIDKEALIGKIKGFTSDVIFRGNHKLMLTGKDSCNPSEWRRGYEQGVLDTNNLIAQTPAADVVEVCRCRDCKWTDNVLFKNKVIWCDHDEQWVEEDNFCKYGSRRERKSE